MTWPAGSYISVLQHGVDDTNLTTYTTPSLTIPEDRQVFLFYTIRGGASTPAVPTINKSGAGTLGMTSEINAQNASTFDRAGVFRLVLAAGAGYTGAVDIVSSVAASGCAWSFIVVDAVDTRTGAAGAVVQSAANSFTTNNAISCALSALAKASNISLFGLRKNNDEAVSVANGSKLSEDVGANPAITLTVGYQSPGTTSDPDFSWATNAIGVKMSLEIKTRDTQTHVATSVTS